MMRRAVAVLVLVVVASGAIWYFGLREGAGGADWEASGVVEAVEADLGFQAGGRVAEVLVREGDRVARGEVLALLDVSELEAARAAAQSQLAGARAQLADLEAGARPEELASARAAVTAAAERVAEGRREVARLRPLVEAGAVPGQLLDQAGTTLQVAEAQHEQALEALRLLEAGARIDQVRVRRAAVGQAEAGLAQVDAALDQAVVRAPFDGVVTVRHREPGEAVSPGSPVVTVLDPGNRWVRIYIPEPRVSSITLGSEAEIWTDGSERRFRGRVIYIANEAEFTPRNVQTPEERVKLVFAVRVAIEGDPDQVLKSGLPADVRFVDAVIDAPN